MANPLFHPPGAALRLADAAVYTAIAAQYHFGVPLITGVAPQTLAATYGVTFFPTTSGDLASMIPGVAVAATPCVVTGYAPDGVTVAFQRVVSSGVGGGTLVGVNWVDAAGVTHPDVDWSWTVGVELYSGASTFLGKWEQQVVTWTGDGSSGRLIPTTLDLSTGAVAIWVFPQTTYNSLFRYRGANGTAMVGTAGAFNPGDTLGGIMSFTASGFTVTDHTAVNTRPNTNLIQYTALVLRDSTSDNRYMRFATYNPFSPDWDAGHSVPFAGATRTLTQAWIFGRTGQYVFGSDDFVAPNSVSFGIEAKTVTNQITALGVGALTVGTDNNVNNNTLTYYAVGFSIPVGDPVRALFRTFKTTGTGSVVTVPLGFLPAFATARLFTTSLPTNQSDWRGPWNAGTTSQDFDLNTQAANGIRAFSATSLDLGVTVAPNGQDVYGFALVGAGSVSVSTPTVYTRIQPPTVPTGPTNATVSGGNGCVASVAPGVGNAGGSGCDY